MTGTLDDIKKAIDDAVQEGIDKLQDTAEAIVAPVVDVVTATEKCYDDARVSGFCIPGVSPARYTTCMLRKGFSSKQSSTLLGLE